MWSPQVICQLRRAENIMFLSADLGRNIEIMVINMPWRVFFACYLFLRDENPGFSNLISWLPPSGCPAVCIGSGLPQRNARSPYCPMLLQQRSAFDSSGKNALDASIPMLCTRDSCFEFIPWIWGYLVWILTIQALVSSGNITPDNFTGSDVQPSELCSLPVPRRFRNERGFYMNVNLFILICPCCVLSFEGKTYIQLFQYMISKRTVCHCSEFKFQPLSVSARWRIVDVHHDT